MLRAFGPARRGIYAVIVAAIACGIAAVPVASGADTGYSSLLHDQLAITDADGGDGDNVAEPGETFSLNERIRNAGPSSVNTLSSYLYSTSSLVSVGAGSSILVGMNETSRADLIAEAERYLAAVAVFRAEGCEPHWRPEPGARRRQRSSREPSAGLL